jgi:phosphoenolpyruvate carboxykinase (GTP)
MAMLPFCGYNMGDYFAHYLEIGSRPGAKLPRIYYVNWFRTDENGKFLWPGYGENSRVLKWIFERCEGKAHAVETPIGRLPVAADLDTTGLNLPPEKVDKLLSVDIEGWLAEVPLIREHFSKFADHLPPALKKEVDDLEDRLRKARK